MKKIVVFGVFACLVFLHQKTFAIDYSLNGFFTVGYTKTDEDNLTYLNEGEEVDSDGTFAEDTLLGIQLDAALSKRWRFTVQKLFSDNKENEHQTEWAFVGYQASQAVEIRAGRMRVPYFMLSDFLEVGQAYPWARPPDEIYATEAVPFSSFDGIDAIIKLDLNFADLEIHPFVGDTDVRIIETDKQWGFATRLMFENFSFRYGWSTRDAVFLQPIAGTPLPPPGTPPPPAFNGKPYPPEFEGIFVGYGFQGEWDNWLVMAEITEATLKSVFLPSSDAFYVTLGYRIGDFLPNITVANRRSDKKLGPFTTDQSSVTLGLRYDLNAHSSLKVEWKNVDVDSEPTDFGFFNGHPDDNVNVFSIVYDFVF